MFKNNDSTIAGKIQLEEGRGGKLKFYAFNHNKRRRVHIGTLIGGTYEKVASILRQPEPSLCVTTSEFGALVDAGAQFIRIIAEGATYSISVPDFKRQAVEFYLPAYGPQLRVPLRAWQYSSAVTKRNSRTDAPALVRSVMDVIADKRERQLNLFG